MMKTLRRARILLILCGMLVAIPSAWADDQNRVIGTLRPIGSTVQEATIIPVHIQPGPDVASALLREVTVRTSFDVPGHGTTVMKGILASLTENDAHPCSYLRAGIDRDPSLQEWVLTSLLESGNRKVLTALNEVLAHPSLCARPTNMLVRPAVRNPVLAINKDRRVVSTNPAWNACTSGGSIPLELIRKNTDAYEHRQRSVRLRVPFTCRDYHRGDVSLWQHPDYASVLLELDTDGRVLSTLQVD